MRIRRAWAIAAAALFARGAHAAPSAPGRGAHPPPKPVTLTPPTPPPPLAMLPSIPRVTVTAHGAAVVVTEEVNLPRGEWKGEALHFHVAFGVPGPHAIDARLVAVEDGELEADPEAAGEPLVTEPVPRRPPGAHGLLGRDAMAGVVVHVRPDAMTRALAPGNMATLRIRSVADATAPDPDGASSVVVRLGVSRSTPLTLGRILAASSSWPLSRVEAHLCGPEADPQPLAAAIVTASASSSKTTPPSGGAIAPVLAVRHATDDLCIRFWHE